MTVEPHSRLDWLPYLHFGYLPPREPTLPFDLPSKVTTLSEDLNSAARHAGSVLSRVVHKSITPGKTHFIPLSGGLDSRALLAAALEAGADVETLTFGMPGTMDYEYGNLVARAVGCRHQSLNLLDHLPDTAALVEAVRNGGKWTYTFDAYFNRLLTRQMGSEPIVLHGFVGETVAGSHYNPKVPDDHRAVKAFANSQQFIRNLSLIRADDEPSTWLPTIDEIPEVRRLSAYERLDFCIRQIGCIRPIVIDPGVDVRTPFTHPDWLEQMFSAPTKWRRGCHLYEAALISRWPELFKLPTKNHLGLGLHIPRLIRTGYTFPLRVYGRLNQTMSWKSRLQYRRQNYIDYARRFREPGPMLELARESLTDLNNRRVVPWLNPLQILADHVLSKGSFEQEIQILIGLEINLKVSSK